MSSSVQYKLTIYSLTSTNSHLSLMATFLSQQTVHALTYIKTSLQWWLPLYNDNSQKHVPNYQNNLSKMGSFLSHFGKSQEWPWNLICKAHWWLILLQQSCFDCVPLIYTATVSKTYLRVCLVCQITGNINFCFKKHYQVFLSFFLYVYYL